VWALVVLEDFTEANREGQAGHVVGKLIAVPPPAH
jgi:hypothetical protein